MKYASITTTVDPRDAIYDQFQQLLTSFEAIQSEINNFNGSQRDVPIYQNLTDLLISWTKDNLTEFWQQSYEVDLQNLNILKQYLVQLTDSWNNYKNTVDLSEF